MFDMYHGRAPCPSCGAERECQGQTEFFDPHWPHGARCFTPGTSHELAYSLEQAIGRRTWIGHFRVQERREPDRLVLLASLDDVTWCPCGTIVLAALHFRVADGPPPSMTMTRLELRAALSPDIADGVDFADGERLVWHDPRPDDAALEELAVAPLAERVERLRAAIAGRIAELGA